MKTETTSKSSTIGWAAIGISVLLHGSLLGSVALFGSISFNFPEPQQNMLISIADARIPMRQLPPLGDSQDAGPVSTSAQAAQPQTALAEQQEAIQKPELDKTPQPEPEKEVEKPVEKPVEKKTNPPVEKPKEQKPVPKKETQKPLEKPAEKEVITTNPKPVEKQAEIQPDPEPTPQEIARELQQQRGTRTRTYGTSDGGSSTGLITPGSGNSNGVSSGPALYTSNLTQLIGGAWQPPVYPQSEVRDCTVEFTIYSKPLEKDAVNKVRIARVMNIKIIKSSGDSLYDQRAMEAVRRVASWPPPPASYKKDTLVVTCRFYLVGDE